LTKDYTHELGAEVRAVSGGYDLEEEGTVEIDGKRVLYAVGNAVVDSSCCGFYGCRYAFVPGYVIKWKYTKNDNGIPVSTVEPVQDQDVRKRITRLLEEKEGATQVRFW